MAAGTQCMERQIGHLPCDRKHRALKMSASKMPLSSLAQGHFYWSNPSHLEAIASAHSSNALRSRWITPVESERSIKNLKIKNPQGMALGIWNVQQSI